MDNHVTLRREGRSAEGVDIVVTLLGRYYHKHLIQFE
jgi:hypothetical protein